MNHGTTHSRLLKLQKKVYRALQAEADRLLGAAPDAIRRYELGYRKDFTGAAILRPKPVSKSRLLQRVRASDVTFVADFHTFPQAQRTALRILRDAFRSGERWCIGIEPVSSQHQAVLDAFQAGKISLEEFHRTIRYADEWGFPWKNYAPLFQWAREHGVRIVALNRPRELLSKPGLRGATVRRVRDSEELRDRDQWAAGVITDTFAEDKLRYRKKGRLRMLVLYGELHVARGHMPTQLEKVSKAYLGKALRSITVHQNQDALYWRLAEQHRELHTEVLELRKNTLCVLSSTPWAKLQSLVSWAEGDASSFSFEGDGADEDEEDETWLATDYLAMVRTYGELIAEFLGLGSVSYESLSVLDVDRADFVESLDGGSFTRSELALIRAHVLANRRIYVPHAEIAYLGTPSQNSASELAALHLFRRSTRTQAIFRPAEGLEDFYRLVVESAFGFLGSLVINPRRKCDLIEDHVRRLRELKRGSPEGFRHELEARELTIAVLRRQDRKRSVSRFPVLSRFLSRPALAFAAMMAAHHVGQIIGKRLHQALLTERLDPELIRELALPAMGRASPRTSFEARYARLLRQIPRSRAVSSKTHTL